MKLYVNSPSSSTAYTSLALTASRSGIHFNVSGYLAIRALNSFSMLSDPIRVFKILGIGLTVTAFTIYRIFNSLSISGKVRQRTQTYLKLDELNRNIRFTSKWTDADIDYFIERYKQIIHEDNLQCVENTDQFLKMLDEMGKNGPGKLANDIDK